MHHTAATAQSKPQALQRVAPTRAPEATASPSGTPGFSTFMPKPEAPTTITAIQGPKGTPTLPQMTYEDNDFSFGDLVDLLNPLQHIPVVGTLYREATGDIPKPETQVAGDILMGGAVGSMSSLVLGAAITTTLSTGNSSQIAAGGAPVDKQVAQALFGPSTPGQSIQLASADDPAARAAQTQTKLNDPNLGQKIQDALSKANAEDSKKANTTIMDVPASQRAAMLAQTNGLQIGKNLYTRPFNNQHQATLAAQQAGSVKAIPQQSASAPNTDPQNADTQNSAPTDAATAAAVYGSTSGTAPTATAATASAAYASTASSGTASTASKTSPSSGSISATAAKTAPTRDSAKQQDAQSTSKEQPATDSQRLGLLMHQSAQQASSARETGGRATLPPELVQDMMLMALDKYQAASTLTPPPQPTAD